MAYRELPVSEVREVLRVWLAGKGLWSVAEQTGVDRETARPLCGGGYRGRAGPRRW
ncbi:MAG: hypothetical protein QOE48_990 [Mycobacterium sp.]|jgi:hypothetical protein|nr:hypothetical protein [Mycobacterium sp.]MDT5305322.1 hypothetical protein [Mycobacterium sp.]MDT7738229.1 hypothetical protein [Mycobacterium sp.]